MESKSYFPQRLQEVTRKSICADANGSNLKRLTHSRFVEVEPKVNPKTGNEIVFVSGRSGPQQIYKMNIEGTDIVRLTTGEGEASNPAWNPDGQHIAFSWTRGFEPGNFNVFVMNVATQEFVQLRTGQGRNENPTWAPDGRHLVFSSKRGGPYEYLHHAGRWHAGEAIDHTRRKHYAGVE